MIVVGFFLLLEGLSLLVDLSFGEDTGLDVDFSDWFEVDVHCVVALLLLVFFLWLLFFGLVHCVVQLGDDFGVELSWDFGCFWSEHPFWHTGQCLFALSSFEIVCIESGRGVLLLLFGLLSLVNDQWWVLLNIGFLSLIESHPDLILFFLLSHQCHMFFFLEPPLLNGFIF